MRISLQTKIIDYGLSTWYQLLASHINLLQDNLSSAWVISSPSKIPTTTAIRSIHLTSSNSLLISPSTFPSIMSKGTDSSHNTSKILSAKPAHFSPKWEFWIDLFCNSFINFFLIFLPRFFSYKVQKHKYSFCFASSNSIQHAKLWSWLAQTSHSIWKYFPRLSFIPCEVLVFRVFLDSTCRKVQENHQAWVNSQCLLGVNDPAQSIFYDWSY